MCTKLNLHVSITRWNQSLFYQWLHGVRGQVFLCLLCSCQFIPEYWLVIVSLSSHRYHKVGNPSKTVPAVTMHLYCPPFEKCKIWLNPNDASHPSKACICNYSEYGDKHACDKFVVNFIWCMPIDRYLGIVLRCCNYFKWIGWDTSLHKSLAVLQSFSVRFSRTSFKASTSCLLKTSNCILHCESVFCPIHIIDVKNWYIISGTVQSKRFEVIERCIFRTKRSDVANGTHLYFENQPCLSSSVISTAYNECGWSSLMDSST